MKYNDELLQPSLCLSTHIMEGKLKMLETNQKPEKKLHTFIPYFVDLYTFYPIFCAFVHFYPIFYAFVHFYPIFCAFDDCYYDFTENK